MKLIVILVQCMRVENELQQHSLVLATIRAIRCFHCLQLFFSNFQNWISIISDWSFPIFEGPNLKKYVTTYLFVDILGTYLSKGTIVLLASPFIPTLLICVVFNNSFNRYFNGNGNKRL